MPLHELRGLRPEQMRERGAAEMRAWEDVKEKGGIEYVKSRPTVLMFHANAGESISTLAKSS